MQREIQFQFFVVKSHLQEFIFQNFYYLLLRTLEYTYTQTLILRTSV